MDRRVTPYSGRVAHVSLKGRISAPLTEGRSGRIVVPLADLRDKPGGARDRQLLMGAAVTVIDHEEGHLFVQSRRDGYCGWVESAAVGEGPEPTHWVAAPATHLHTEPLVQAPETASLSLGSQLAVTAFSGAWAQTPQGFVPLCHLRPIGQWAPDAVSVAESLLGTPYLWGGNSRFGIDCSGLVQVALHATGCDCPGDSDMQMEMGRPLAPQEGLSRGDLLFWKGHVALVVNPDVLIHANGATMSVACEGIVEAIRRIAEAGGGPVLARKRPG
ncbi:NlpC/P60 family protein [Tabrizicola sp. YIM 78059]|uniref:C40 family peptidase n=1 Tax=Tabrizicola sp. YIM 78059 TaxID=2529861 RepID=UPI0010AB4B15|nr:NlpC/P60 family protein [Tabrizicola sp. YIM 78059]